MTVEVETLRPGDGRRYPKAGDLVSVHYTGRLVKGGAEFDSSRAKGTPFSFELGAGHVIHGWEVALPQMSMGECSKITISADDGYGAKGCVDQRHASGTGVIPPHADLLFDVELLDINWEHMLAKYRESLDKWKREKLANFDSDTDFAAKMSRKHGGREEYAAFLEQSVVAKFEAEAAKKRLQ